MVQADRMLTANDVASICGVTREGMRLMRQRGDGPPAIRIGGASITGLTDFVAWIARQLVRRPRPLWLRRLAR